MPRNRVVVVDRRQLVPWLALAGVLVPVWLLGGSLLIGALRPGYDPLRDSLSELGEQGAPTALVWNVGGFGVIAVFYAAYSVAVFAGFGARLIVLLTALQTILIAASASFDCDPGCPPVPETTRMLGHIIVGLAYFGITCVLPLAAWRTFRRRKEWRSYARPSLIVGFILVVLFLVGPALGEDRVGVWQRVTLLIALSWQAAIAIRLHALLRGQSAAEPSPCCQVSSTPTRSAARADDEPDADGNDRDRPQLVRVEPRELEPERPVGEVPQPHGEDDQPDDDRAVSRAVRDRRSGGGLRRDAGWWRSDRARAGHGCSRCSVVVVIAIVASPA